ncbi:MAG: DHH family phosphoesterase [Clostridia bacterium]|nr:DHH family phosphoesterase [Clostridia bacterium]
MYKTKNITQSLLNLNNNLPIYICGHIKPDQDCICACIALAEFLAYYKKQVYILINKNDEKIVSWKPTQKYFAESICHKDYAFVALDINETNRLGVYEQNYINAKFKFNIDHHQGNETKADFILDVPYASSTCEIVYTLIKRNNKKILTKDICEYLYAGIFTDTNGLSRRLSPQTLLIIQDLLNAGIDYTYINRQTLTIRSMYEFLAMSKMATEIVKEDNFHYLIVDRQKPEYVNLTHNTITKKLAEDLRKIDEIKTFVIIMIQQDKTIVGKVMTNTSDFACDIAKLFGGGGHKKEAGFTTTSFTIDQILNLTNNFLNQKI